MVKKDSKKNYVFLVCMLVFTFIGVYLLSGMGGNDSVTGGFVNLGGTSLRIFSWIILAFLIALFVYLNIKKK